MFLFNRRDTLNGTKVFLGFNSRIQNNWEYVLPTITIFFKTYCFHSTHSLNLIIAYHESLNSTK